MLAVCATTKTRELCGVGITGITGLVVGGESMYVVLAAELANLDT